jgi:hypothetical protein
LPAWRSRRCSTPRLPERSVQGRGNPSQERTLMPDAPLAETVAAKLSVHVGPHVARMMIRSFAKKAGRETLSAMQLPAFVQEIRPMLTVLIGKAATEAVGADLAALGGK